MRDIEFYQLLERVEKLEAAVRLLAKHIAGLKMMTPAEEQLIHEALCWCNTQRNGGPHAISEVHQRLQDACERVWDERETK